MRWDDVLTVVNNVLVELTGFSMMRRWKPSLKWDHLIHSVNQNLRRLQDQSFINPPEGMVRSPPQTRVANGSEAWKRSGIEKCL
jgi:hypothetical protein